MPRATGGPQPALLHIQWVCLHAHAWAPIPTACIMPDPKMRGPKAAGVVEGMNSCKALKASAFSLLGTAGNSAPKPVLVLGHKPLGRTALACCAVRQGLCSSVEGFWPPNQAPDQAPKDNGILCRWKLNGRPTFDFQDMQRNKRRELERLSDIYRKNLEKAKVDFVEGRGRLLDKNTVEVNGKQYKVSQLS